MAKNPEVLKKYRQFDWHALVNQQFVQFLFCQAWNTGRSTFQRVLNRSIHIEPDFLLSLGSRGSRNKLYFLGKVLDALEASSYDPQTEKKNSFYKCHLAQRFGHCATYRRRCFKPAKGQCSLF